MFRCGITVAVALAAFATSALWALGSSTAAASSCNQTLFDSGGYKYDLEELHGALGDGGSNGPAGSPPGPVETTNAWSVWGNVYVFSPGADLLTPVEADTYGSFSGEKCGLGLGGREVALPVGRLHGLDLQHRWFVDTGPLHGVRILTVLHNPGAAPITAIVVQGDPTGGGHLGSAPFDGLRVTADGSGVLSPAASWGVTTDRRDKDEAPALAHVWDGRGGAMRIGEVVLGNSASFAAFYWDWGVTVPPGATRAFVSYEIQAAVPNRDTAAEIADAVAQAEGHERQPLASLYQGMSAAEIAGTLNWPQPAPSVRITRAKSKGASRPKHATGGKRVRLDGGRSIAASGLPQCAISRYAWKADDRATGSRQVFAHRFKPGRHRVTLTVSTSCGGSGTASVRFAVARPHR